MKKRVTISLIFSFLCLVAFSQQGYVIYKSFNKGKVQPGENVAIYKDGMLRINSTSKGSDKYYVNYKDKTKITLIHEKNGKIIGMKSPFHDKIPFKTKKKFRETICGIPCKKIEFTSNSNQIAVYYCDTLAIKALPGIGSFPQLGTILKMVINKTHVIEATKISNKPYKNMGIDFPKNITYVKTRAQLNRALIDSRYSRIPLFKNDTINYAAKLKYVFPKEYNKVYHYLNGNIILKKVKFPIFSKNDAVFLNVTERSNGDAYDRTAMIFALPVDGSKDFVKFLLSNKLNDLNSYKAANGKTYKGMVADKNYQLPYELMRFITPFGAGAYSKSFELEGVTFEEKAIYTQDITDLKNILSGKEVYIMANIANYDKDGYIIDAELKVFSDNSPKNFPAGSSDYYKMLSNTTNYALVIGQEEADMFDGDSLKLKFELNHELKNAYLRYLVTGWGPVSTGDEFTPKENKIYLNDKLITTIVPWRNDCMTFRPLNPVSGNFSNGLSSSDCSRSNWCPGTNVVPFFIPLGNLTPGKYEIKIAIPMSKPDKDGHSGWNVSCLLEGVK